MKTIHVLPVDIVRGKREDARFCPISLAVKRELGLERFVPNFVVVGPDRLWIGLNDYRLPSSVTDWIRDYDAGEPVEPITFDVEEVVL